MVTIGRREGEEEEEEEEDVSFDSNAGENACVSASSSLLLRDAPSRDLPRSAGMTNTHLSSVEGGSDGLE